MAGINDLLGVVVLFRPRCKTWSCPDCAEVNKSLWTSRAVLGAKSFIGLGYVVDLVTVTAHEKHNVERAVEKLPDQWNKLRNRWQRTVEKPQYMLTSEVGAEGHFHLHLVTTGSPGERWWKDNARASGFGYMAKESEQSLEPWKAGFYISKYLTKGIASETWAKGFHRVRASRYWPKLASPPPDDSTSFMPFEQDVSVRDMRDNFAGQGYSVALADEKASWHTLQTGELTQGSVWLTLQIPQPI